MLELSSPTISHSEHDIRVACRLGPDEMFVSIRAPRHIHLQLDHVQQSFIPMAIFKAITLREDLAIAGAVPDDWWINLTGGFVPLLAKLNDLKPIKISRSGPGDLPRANAGRTALMFSAGVDSFYSRQVLDRAGIRPRFYVNINAGAHDYDRQCWANRVANVRAIAEADGADLITIDTNFHEIVPHDHVRSHVIRNLSAGFALSSIAPSLVYSSAHSFEDISFKSAKTHGIDYIDHTIISTMGPPSVSLSVLGWDATRIEKTRFIAEDPMAIRHLDVCTDQTYQANLRPGIPINCGRCPKCLRTMFTLEYSGRLAAFESLFDMTRIREARDGILDDMLQGHPVDQAVVRLIRGFDQRPAA